AFSHGICRCTAWAESLRASARPYDMTSLLHSSAFVHLPDHFLDLRLFDRHVPHTPVSPGAREQLRRGDRRAVECDPDARPGTLDDGDLAVVERHDRVIGFLLEIDRDMALPA